MTSSSTSSSAARISPTLMMRERNVFVPHVIEPSAGATRSLLAFLCEAFEEEKIVDRKDSKKEDVRTVLRFHPRLAPMKAAIFPACQEGTACREGHGHLQGPPEAHGRLLRRKGRRRPALPPPRMRPGTPFCLTIDGQTAQDNTVTVRERDSMKTGTHSPADRVAALPAREPDPFCQSVAL